MTKISEEKKFLNYNFICKSLEICSKVDSGVSITEKSYPRKHPQALFPDPLGGGGKHPTKPLPTPRYVKKQRKSIYDKKWLQMSLQ